MQKEFILGIYITTFVIFAACPPNVLAYESYNNSVCEDCHSFTDFSSFTSSHSYHVNTLYISPCTKCHQGTDPYNYIYEQVATSKCANCHGGVDSIVSHHIDSYGGGCDACHNTQLYQCPDPVMNDNTNEVFISIQSAIDDPGAVDDDIVKITASDYDENILYDRNIILTLSGGYDCNYTENPSTSETNSLTISHGTVMIENLVIR